jgi:hypothetical protein
VPVYKLEEDLGEPYSHDEPLKALKMDCEAEIFRPPLDCDMDDVRFGDLFSSV